MSTMRTKPRPGEHSSEYGSEYGQKKSPKKKPLIFKGFLVLLAESGGFEPPIRLLVYTLSRRAP